MAYCAVRRCEGGLQRAGGGLRGAVRQPHTWLRGAVRPRGSRGTAHCTCLLVVRRHLRVAPGPLAEGEGLAAQRVTSVVGSRLAATHHAESDLLWAPR
eukprot:scaffold19221_cov60-Phaeocystis_antarctica.AAC.1